MKVSVKAEYGIRALVDLAQHYGQGTVQSSEIAARQAIPEPYLDQLLTVLRKAGIINSRRGPQGGHMLARDPDEITMREVVLTLEGSLAPISCVEQDTNCPNVSGCIQREVWQRVADATNEILASVSIGSLVRQLARREQRGVYSI